MLYKANCGRYKSVLAFESVDDIRATIQVKVNEQYCRKSGIKWPTRVRGALLSCVLFVFYRRWF